MEIRARGRDALEISLKRLFRYSGNKSLRFENIRPLTQAMIKGFLIIDPAIAPIFFLNSDFEGESSSNQDKREIDKIFITGMANEMMIPKNRIPSSPSAFIMTAKPIYVLKRKQL